MNNPQLFRPTYYLNFESIEVDGKLLIYCHVPESTQAHSYKNVYYDRNRDGDFELANPQRVQQFLPYYVHYILGQGGDGKLECAVCVWQD